MSNQKRPSNLVPEEGNGDQPSIQDLLKVSRIIDENINEEEQRRLKMEAMADHGLVEGTTPSKSSAKKDAAALDAANQKNADLQRELEQMRAQLAAASEVKPVEQEQQTPPAAPVVPTAPVDPFAAGAA